MLCAMHSNRDNILTWSSPRKGLRIGGGISDPILPHPPKGERWREKYTLGNDLIWKRLGQRGNEEKKKRKGHLSQWPGDAEIIGSLGVSWRLNLDETPATCKCPCSVLRGNRHVSPLQIVVSNSRDKMQNKWSCNELCDNCAKSFILTMSWKHRIGAGREGRIDSYWGNLVGFSIDHWGKNIKQNSKNEDTANGK